MITLDHVSFSYGKTTVVRDAGFHVPDRSIFGFAGPNGAGKTTTLKLILGLLKPDSGEILIRNRNLAGHRKEILSKTGSLIETPSLYPHLTAGENLEIARRVYRVEKFRPDQVLSQTGILAAKNKKVREFSLGMKQRLGIALALLHSPELLILDEPINGLDPGGILEFREFLKNLVNREGLTVLISSHILSELELVISHAGIISDGEIRFHGTMEELRGKSLSRLFFDVSDPEKALSLISPVADCRLDGGRIEIREGNRDLTARLIHLLSAAGHDIYQAVQEQPNLESVFHELTRKEVRHV